jgi:hypothetical protein
MAARADITEVGLSGLVNADLTTYSGGSNYPQHGGSLTVSGIPFDLATIGPQSDTGIVQTTGAQDFSIPVDVLGGMSVYVLINSAYGACGSDVGELDFVGSSQTYAYPLVEGGNIRDHFAGQFCNQAPAISGSASFGGGADRLDLNSIQLPSSFATQTLESIDFKSFGMGQLGQPFLAALTVESGRDLSARVPEQVPAPVPEPGDLRFLGTAMAAIVLRRYL